MVVCSSVPPFNVYAGTDNITRGWIFHARLPKGHEKQMESFENQIESWLEEYENDLPPTTDS
jgi:hypothetical protein